MTALGSTLPNLDFGTWVVPFPERGHHVFLGSDDLHTPREAGIGEVGHGIWLMRTDSGAGVIIPSEAEVVRDGVPVVGFAVLHHGEHIEFASHLARFAEVQRVVIEQGSRLDGRKCPHCLVMHEAGEEVIRCPFCGEGYCLDCWEALIGARCCSRSCPLAPGRLDEPSK
jgi:hypothetical protein